MTRANFTKSVITAVQQRLMLMGFRTRRQGLSSLSVEDILGLVGLNMATGGRGDGVLEINPVIGVRNQHVERIVAELMNEPFDEVSPFAVGANVGYLSPETKYRAFLFVDGSPPDRTADELAGAVRMYGLDFIHSNVPLAALLETMRSSRFAIAYVVAYRIPVALHLLGKSIEADAFLAEELTKLSARTDPAAERYRVFAKRFKERGSTRLG